MSRYFRRFRSHSLAVAVSAAATFGLLVAGQSYAWVPTRTSDGDRVFWKRPSNSSSFKLDFAGNPTNRSGLSANDIKSAVVRGLQRWEKASGGAMDFDYWQGTDSSLYETDSDYDGISSIHFASAASRDAVLPANVLGMTQVWYNTDTGEILETDIVLNDLQAQFTTDPTDTTGYGNGRPSTIYEGTQLVYIENVLTHELGHALGLSHSGGLQATMLFVESPEQAHLSCDEQVAIRSLYPMASDSKKRGGITGRMISPDGAGVFGAQVSAISRLRGVAVASVVTDRDGDYEFSALEPGDYFLVAEPFFGGSSALTSYYDSMDTAVCSNGTLDFNRSAYLADGSGHELANFEVRAGKTTAAGALQVSCSSLAKAEKNADNEIETSASPSADGFGYIDRLSWGEERKYLVGLPGSDGVLRVHALGYSLYSPVKPQLALLDDAGNAVTGGGIATSNPVYSGDSGYQNFDAEIRATGLDPNRNYYVRVRGSYVDSFKVPGGPEAVDTSPFFVLAVTKGNSSPALVNELADDARCSMNESFARYSSPKSKPTRESTESSSVGCAPAANATGAKVRPATGAKAVLDLIAGYLPIVLAALGLRLMIRPRRRL